ncbi:hypothetical protein QLH32_05090 [Acinetobacter corruptisaponis]|uniref:Methyl-coenzyme M reductase n=1 Tax=Acinetobacter corruptisaponis TaxID=3045147 RepID=A0ABY8S5M4_9GAMM|nr:hypothetical protein [Acinetobacter sp. KCTC 92772]WHP06850.1 hypothetical protein QLH32_05090 [Acinetobacter sp. KCTC 92772]
MAKIPMGNFGNAMPQVQRIQMPQDQSGQMIANTLQNVGQVAEQQHQRQVEKDRLQGATVASNFSLDIENLAGDYRQRVAAGEDATLIDREFSTEFAKRLDDTLLQIPETVRKDFAPKFTNFGNQQIGSFYEIGRRTEVETAKTNAKVTLDNLSKMKNTELADQYAAEAIQSSKPYLSPSEALLYAKDYKQNQSLNTINDEILTATQNSDIDGLQRVYTELSKEDGKYNSLDGQTINSLKSSISSRILSIQNHQQQQANKRESEAKSVLSDYVTDLGTGLPLSPERQKNVLLATKGTPFEEDALLYAKHEPQFQEFRVLDTNSMKAKMDALQASMLKNQSNNASRDKKIYDVYNNIYKDKLDSAKNDPVAYAVSQNQDIKRITGIDVISNPAQAVKNILHNDTVLQTLRKTEPNLNLDPIGKDDLDSIKQSLERANISQTLGFMSQLIKQVPKNAYGQNLIEKIFKQIGDGNDSYLFASQALANNLNYKGASVASGILQGQRLIQQKNSIIPQAVEADFRTAIGNLAQKGDFKADLDALSSMYAFYASKRGISHAKKDDAIDEQTFKDALNAVTGGIYTQQKQGMLWGTRNAGFTLDGNDVDSWKVEMPYGMDEAKFKTRLDDSYKRASEISGISVDFLKSNYRLQVRDNTNLTDTTIYDLLDANNQKLTTKGKDGKAVGYSLRVYRK